MSDLSPERIPVPIEEEAGWAPEVDWKFWKRGNSLTPTRIPILDHLSNSPIAVPRYRNTDVLDKFMSSNLQFLCGAERSLFLFLNIWERSGSRLEPQTDFHTSISRLMHGEDLKRGDPTCFDIISNVSQYMLSRSVVEKPVTSLGLKLVVKHKENAAL